MKTLARWGAHHIRLTRLLIIFGSIFLFFYVSFAGFYFQRLNGSSASNVLMLCILGCTIFALIGYPYRHEIRAITSQKFGFLMKWKIFDFILVLAFTLIGFNFGNELETEVISEQPGMESLIEGLSYIPAFSVADVQNTRLERKGIIKRFIDKMQNRLIKFFIKKFDVLDAEKGWALAGFITLYVLIYLVLFYGLAILSCSIACNGSGTVALIVFILGELLLFFGLYGLIYLTRNWLERDMEGGPDKKQNSRFSIITSLILVALKYLAILISSSF